MQVITFTKKLTDLEKELFESYLKTKLGRIEKYCHEFDDDAVKLSITAERFTNKNAYRVDMCMELPKAAHKALYSTEDSHDLRTAIDSSKEKLVEQIKKAMDKLHHEHQRAT
ncbi:MAG: hypothetical protein ACD_28C00039G0003 [uncultured bacterium]|nr:MAG: hypothetical protein ACD_28C00039G0003 [uncultured bacterium]